MCYLSVMRPSNTFVLKFALVCHVGLDVGCHFHGHFRVKASRTPHTDIRVLGPQQPGADSAVYAITILGKVIFTLPNLVQNRVLYWCVADIIHVLEETVKFILFLHSRIHVLIYVTCDLTLYSVQDASTDAGCFRPATAGRIGTHWVYQGVYS